MFIPAEIVLVSYLPDELEVGMLFTNRISVGVIEPYVELFELEEIPEDPDAFMSKHGVPVELRVVDEDDNTLANHDEIGWWDDGGDSEFLREVTLDDVNYILRELEGYVDIHASYNETDGVYESVLIDDMVVLSLVPEEEFDDWDATLEDGLED
jgi:hypothetical protein